MHFGVPQAIDNTSVLWHMTHYCRDFLQQPIVRYERQSSFDQQWNDLLSVLSTPSDIPDFTLDDVASGNMQYNSDTAIVQNASMCSAVEPAIDDNCAMQPSKQFCKYITIYILLSFIDIIMNDNFIVSIQHLELPHLCNKDDNYCLKFLCNLGKITTT